MKIPNELAAYVPPPAGVRNTPESGVSEGVLNRGMISSIYAANIPEGSVALAQNVRVRYDKTSRRIMLYQAVYDSGNNPTKLLFPFKDYNGLYKLLKFGRDGRVYRRSGNSWVLIGTATASIYPDIFYTAAIYNNTVYFSTNGQGPIQSIDAALTTISSVTTPNYKYITTFYNRVVGANKVGTPNVPIEVGWSADGVPTEWNNAVDESAGQGPLMESPSDTSDFITGIFGFTNVLVILRERSVWEATKNPSASNPFNFYCRYAGIGCDCPRSAVVIPNGIIFADTQTRGVYLFNIGGAPELLSEAVVEEMFPVGINVEAAVGAYDSANKEYHLKLGNKVWVYNIVTKAWSYDTYDWVIMEELTAMAFSDKFNLSITYDSVTGTYDANTNTYDSFDAVENGGMIYSTIHGHLFKENVDNLELDPIYLETFVTEITSKLYETADDDIIINSIAFTVSAVTDSAFKLLYSKNGREFIELKEFGLSQGDSQLVRARFSLRARKFQWKIISEYGRWHLHKYSLRVMPATMSQAGE